MGRMKLAYGSARGGDACEPGPGGVGVEPGEFQGELIRALQPTAGGLAIRVAAVGVEQDAADDGDPQFTALPGFFAQVGQGGVGGGGSHEARLRDDSAGRCGTVGFIHEPSRNSGAAGVRDGVYPVRDTPPHRTAWRLSRDAGRLTQAAGRIAFEVMD